MNPKQKGVKAGYHYGSDPLPHGCPYELRTDERTRWLDGWQLGLKLRECHREELLAMITAVSTTGSETPDSVMKRFNERFK